MKNIFKNISLHFDRSFSKGLIRQLVWLIGIMMVVYLILASLSYASAFYTMEKGNTRWYDILWTLVNPGPGNGSMSTPFSLICSVLGLVIFSGMLISVISNVLERRVESFKKGETDYKVSHHTVVLGFNKSIPSLLSTIYEKNHDSYILLMSEKDSEEIRDWVHANLKSEIEEAIIFMNGSRVADDDLARLRLGNHVSEIFVLGEENETAHDSINLECVCKIASYIPNGQSVACHVQIDSHTMYSVLQSVDFSKTQIGESDIIGNHLKFFPFNFNEIWSQKALATIPEKIEVNGKKTYKYYPLDGTGITSDSPKHVHLIIVGMNEMGTSLAVNAAHILHFPNFKEGDFSTYSHITFIDCDANHLGMAFRNRYRHLFSLSIWRNVQGDECKGEKGWVDPIADKDSSSPYRHLGSINFMDIRWEFIQGEIYDDSIQEYLIDCSTHENEITTIALCDEDSEKNAAFCLAQPEAICMKAHTILVRQKETNVTIDLLRKMPGHEKIRSFGMMSGCYGENLISDIYGKIVNACYAGIDVNGLLTSESKLKIQNEIDEKWDDCSILDKWSSIYSVNMLFTKLRSLGIDTQKNFTQKMIDEIMASEEIRTEIQKTEHNRWNTEKLLLGFSPLKKEEQDLFLPLRDQKEALTSLKKKWAAEKKKHLDICSNEMLPVIDKYTVGFDNIVNSQLWLLFTITQNR